MINVIETQYKVTMQWGIDGYQDPYAKVKSSIYSVKIKTNTRKKIDKTYKKPVWLYDKMLDVYKYFNDSDECVQYIYNATNIKENIYNIRTSIRKGSLIKDRFFVSRNRSTLLSRVNDKKDLVSKHKEVICVTTGKRFKTRKAAGLEYNISSNGIKKAILCNDGKCHGYQFRYA